MRLFNVQRSAFHVRTAWCALLAGAALAGGAETNLPVYSLGGGLFQVGAVTIDTPNRIVRFPAAVNLRDETIEYAVVSRTGKTHESIFRTDARPQDIHVAMLLLGAMPQMTNRVVADGKALPSGDPVSIQASWTNNNGARVQFALEDLVLIKKTKEPMARGDWVYNGSNFSEGAFTAQRDGSIISTHIDPDALINNPRPGREDDDSYAPRAGKLPAVGTPVEIWIRVKS